MSWKNLKQTSLADALLVEHAAITELDGVLKLIDWHPIAVNQRAVFASDQHGFLPIVLMQG